MFNLIFTFFIFLILPVIISAGEPNIIKKNFYSLSSINFKENNVLSVKQGFGPDEIGVIKFSESNPEGPMSFAVGKNGHIYILDQVNKRIQVFRNGKRVKTIKIPTDTFVDIELLSDGKIVLLDNLIKKSVYIIDSQGKIISIIPLEGRFIPDATMVTGLHINKNNKWSGIWANIDGRSVRISDINGMEVERVVVPGIFNQGGTNIFNIEKIANNIVQIRLYEKGSLSRFNTFELSLNLNIVHIIGVGTDHNENIYIGLMLNESKNREQQLSNYIIKIDSKFKEIKRFKIGTQKSDYEVWRPIRICHDGQVYQLIVSKERIVLKKFVQ